MSRLMFYWNMLNTSAYVASVNLSTACLHRLEIHLGQWQYIHRQVSAMNDLRKDAEQMVYEFWMGRAMLLWKRSYRTHRLQHSVSCSAAFRIQCGSTLQRWQQHFFQHQRLKQLQLSAQLMYSQHALSQAWRIWQVEKSDCIFFSPLTSPPHLTPFEAKRKGWLKWNAFYTCKVVEQHAQKFRCKVVFKRWQRITQKRVALQYQSTSQMLLVRRGWQLWRTEVVQENVAQMTLHRATMRMVQWKLGSVFWAWRHVVCLDHAAEQKVHLRLILQRDPFTRLRMHAAQQSMQAMLLQVTLDHYRGTCWRIGWNALRNEAQGKADDIDTTNDDHKWATFRLILSVKLWRAQTLQGLHTKKEFDATKTGAGHAVFSHHVPCTTVRSPSVA